MAILCGDSMELEVEYESDMESNNVSWNPRSIIDELRFLIRLGSVV